MDRTDLRILDLLQRNGSLAASEIADRVGLSKAPCWRRIQKLQESGIIKETVALLDAKALNVATTVFVTVRTSNHSSAWFDRFLRAVNEIPEIVDVYRLSGDVDYLLRVVVPGTAAYDVVYRKLIASVDFLDISASFALEAIRSTTALPLSYVTLR